MTSKNRVPQSSRDNQTALKIGSRVRCTDDAVEGRITWANGVAVKIQWDDGEHVTWRRDSLADRPIDILEPSDDGQAAANAEPAPVESSVSTEVPAEPPPSIPPAAERATTEPELLAANTATPAVESAVAEPASAVAQPAELPVAPTTPAAAETTVPLKPRRKASVALKEKKLSALDAAAKVLAEMGQPMSCPEMIAAMAVKGYWTSPGGQTPSATLYSALAREIHTKGEKARFRKSGPGQFALQEPR
jgi:hypothetical protein